LRARVHWRKAGSLAQSGSDLVSWDPVGPCERWELALRTGTEKVSEAVLGHTGP